MPATSSDVNIGQDASAAPAAAADAQPRIMAKKATPRGVPASNRPWKTLQTKRTSAATRPKRAPKHSGLAFRVAMAAKKARGDVKETQDRLRAERKEELEGIKARRQEKQRRRAEGELRAAQMQTIDPSKLKKMNKKQLRQVKKTRVNAKTGVVELVGAYS